MNHSCRVDVSTPSRLSCPTCQTLTNIMGRPSHSCMGSALGVHPCLPASIMAMFRVEYSSWEVDILAPRLFHIHPCLVASLMVIIKVDHSFLEIVILTPRLFYNHLNIFASFREEVVLIPLLFYIHPCLLSSVMAM